jgi:hypothetical protein
VVGGNDGTTAALGGVSVDVDTMLLFHPLNGTLTALNADINARSEVTPFTTVDVAIFIGGQNSYGQHQSTVNIFSARVASTTQPSTGTNPSTSPNTNPNTKTSPTGTTNTPQFTSGSALLLANLTVILVAVVMSIF